MERGRNREQQERLPQEAGALDERTPEADDAWAGEDHAWDEEAGAAEARKTVSFFRGLFLSLLLGGLAWALVGLLVYYLFFA
jgi:hypothetical protein